jgi:ferritin-like metal-binding protein YciE
MAETSLEDLFHDTLKDIFYAERKILTTLPKMVKAAQSPELKAAFEKHRQQTEVHVERLVEVFGIIQLKPVGKTCHAIDGILEEGAEAMEDFKGTAALDAGMIAAAQAVEHYEITRYGTLKRWAQNLGLADAVQLLDATLREESQTDTDLSGLADQIANPKAKIAAA